VLCEYSRSWSRWYCASNRPIQLTYPKLQNRQHQAPATTIHALKPPSGGGDEVGGEDGGCMVDFSDSGSELVDISGRPWRHRTVCILVEEDLREIPEYAMANTQWHVFRVLCQRVEGLSSRAYVWEYHLGPEYTARRYPHKSDLSLHNAALRPTTRPHSTSKQQATLQQLQYQLILSQTYPSLVASHRFSNQAPRNHAWIRLAGAISTTYLRFR
jgi:hypothetical protein